MNDVGAVEDFLERSVRVVRIGDLEVGLIRWRGRFFALRNVCAHEWGPVCEGQLRPLSSGPVPGCMELDESRAVIECPWHGWEYDVDSGRALYDPGIALRRYPVVVEGGRVLVDIGRRSP